MGSILLRDFTTNTYLKEHLDFSPSTASYYLTGVTQLDQWRGQAVALVELSSDLMLDFMRALGEAHPPATVNTRRGAIMTLWRSAADKGLCAPPPRVARRRVPRRDPVAWCLDEVGRLFAACDQVRGDWEGLPRSLAWKIALSLFWDSACRLDAVWLARVADVSLERATWYVPAEHVKGQVADKVYALHGDTVALIRASLAAERERLFPFPFGRRQIWPHWKRILADAGLPQDRYHLFHCIRRTAESYAALDRGEEWAAAAVGHTVDVARRSYISKRIVTGHRLIDALPRPAIPTKPALRVVS